MQCFEELCRENYNRIYRYIYAMTADRDAAQDLIQDVFTAALEKGERFLCHENPPAFLYKTARNLTLRYIKRQQNNEVFLDDNIPGADGDLLDALFKDHDGGIDESDYTGQVFSGLDPSQRLLYRTRYLENRPIREIAAEQGASEPAVRMRLLRLRRTIYDIVKDLRLDDY